MTDGATPAERTAKRLYYATKRRVDLIRIIAAPGPNGGGLCAMCKTEHAHDVLEIDHADGITWDRYAMSPQMRSAKYWREHKAGVRLRALCSPCNARDGGRRRWNKHAARRRT